MRTYKLFFSISFLFVSLIAFAQPQVNIAFPDSDNNGFADSLIAGQGYDFNVWARKFPGNVSLESTGDSIEFMQVFKFIGCPNQCTNCYNQYFTLHYGGDGPVYGSYGEDRKYERNTILLHPGDYLITGNTKKGFAFRQTISVKPACSGSGNLIGNLIINFTLSGSNTTGSVELNESNFTFYPNPVSSKLHFNGLPENAVVEFYNSQGQKLSLQMNDGEVDVSGLPTAMYFFKATQNGILFANALFLKAGN